MYPSPAKPVNGVFVHRHVRELSKMGHDVRVISPVPWTPPHLPLPEKWSAYRNTPDKASIDGVPVRYPRHVSFPGANTQPLTSYLYRHVVLDAVNDLAASGFVPDVICANTLLPDGFGSIRAANQYDVPVVTTIHGQSLQVFPDQVGCMPLLKRTADYSAHVIVNSTKLENLAEEYFGPSEHRSTIPYGLPFDEIDAARDCTPPEEVDISDPTLVSVGNLFTKKGHRYALRALASLSSDLDFDYVLIGDGPERERLADEANELGIADSVTFVGEIPNQEVFKYLWHSDVFVLPSYQEAFGVAYIEAMACELPTIGCSGEGPEDFIEHGETGFLVPPEDPDGLSDVLRTILLDTDYQNEIGQQARAFVEREYTWKRNAERVSEILETVV
nr:glycosyltransferase [Halorussus litoreus]